MKTRPTNSQKTKPGAERPQRRPQARLPGGGRGVQIDDRDDEGNSSATRTSSIAQPRTTRPADPDVARGARRELEALVERADELLSGSAELPEPGRSRAPRARSPNAGGGRSPPVVSVTAGSPAARNGPCSYSVNGKREVDELAEERSRARGAAPVCSAIRATSSRRAPRSASAAVAGDLDARAFRAPAIASRLITATMWPWYAGSSRNAAAPRPP